MKIIKTGVLDGQDIWRYKTAYELLWEAIELAKTKQLGDPNCPRCEGSGTAFEPDSDDDVTPEECGCVEIYQNNKNK